jgi:hypothetical protein
MLVKSINQVVDRMEWMFECRGGDVVSFRCFRFASKRLLDMYACRQNGAPQNMSGMSFDQNIRLDTPCVVAKRKRIAMNRRNSPHVRGSERVLFVAWRMVVLK